MKKLFLILLAVLLLMTACSPDTGEDDTDKIDPLQDFKAYIEESESPAEVKGYLDGLMEDADTETSDKLILEYLKYMGGIVAGSTVYEQDVLEAAGFRIISVEGNEQPIVDYHFIEAYSGQLSQEMLDFTAFMVLNSDNPWAKDAGLIISLTDLADRIILGEQFIVKYPDSAMQEQVMTQYGYYLNSFLGGLDNTPIVVYDENAIDPEFIAAYQYLLKTYPNAVTAETVGAFFAELEQSDFAAPYTYADMEKRNEFRNHIEELVSETKSKLEK